MRKEFSFNLQKVLDYRVSLLEKAQQEFALARKNHQEQSALLDSLKQELKEARQEIRKKENQTQAGIWLWNHFIDRLEFDLKQAEARLKELSREVNLRRKILIQASKDKKIIEKLKYNQKMKFDHEQEKKEQKEFDEMAVVRYEHKAY
ncbi:MAG: flagellar export protein FliJ [Desulfonatronovibrionaceae bacterium]